MVNEIDGMNKLVVCSVELGDSLEKRKKDDDAETCFVRSSKVRLYEYLLL